MADPSPAGGGRRVLVVEDTEVFRTFLLRALELLGCASAGVGDADEVLPAVHSFTPDLVLLDWNLAGGSSAAVLTELRRLGLKVIVITGDPGGVGDVDAPVLGKPVHLARLQEVIESA